MKTVYLYVIAAGTDFQMYTNCTDVQHNDSLLSFKDAAGDFHLTSAPWEVVTSKEEVAPRPTPGLTLRDDWRRAMKHLREDELEIQERCENASTGEWWLTENLGVCVELNGAAHLIAEVEAESDGEFIAHAHSDVAELLSRLSEARAEKYEFAAKELEAIANAAGDRPWFTSKLRERAAALRAKED